MITELANAGIGSGGEKGAGATDMDGAHTPQESRPRSPAPVPNESAPHAGEHGGAA